MHTYLCYDLLSLNETRLWDVYWRRCIQIIRMILYVCSAKADAADDEDDEELQFDPNSFMQTMQKMFGASFHVLVISNNLLVISNNL